MKLKRLFIFTFLILFLSSFSFSWLSGYGYRKQITVQGTNLDSNQTHFPLYVYVVDADIDDECDDDGDRSHDIRFTQSDDSVLDVDWLDYSEAGGNATIICFISDSGWTINADGSTTFYIYYGNAAAGDPGTDAGVWNSGYKMVHHLGGANAAACDDETTNNNDVNADFGTPDYQQAGKIYYGINFNGTDEYITVADSSDLSPTGDFTLSLWVNFDALAEAHGLQTVVVKTHGDTPWSEYYIRQQYANEVERLWCAWHNEAETEYDVTSNDYGDLSTGTWYHVVMYKPSSGDMTVYVQGTNKYTGDTVAGNDWDSNGTLRMAAWGGSERMDGKLDEVRIYDGVLGDDWIKFEYYNMNEADSELTWGSEEPAPSGYIPKVIWIK